MPSISASLGDAARHAIAATADKPKIKAPCISCSLVDEVVTEPEPAEPPKTGGTSPCAPAPSSPGQLDVGGEDEDEELNEELCRLDYSLLDAWPAAVGRTRPAQPDAEFSCWHAGKRAWVAAEGPHAGLTRAEATDAAAARLSLRAAAEEAELAALEAELAAMTAAELAELEPFGGREPAEWQRELDASMVSLERESAALERSLVAVDVDDKPDEPGEAEALVANAEPAW